MAASKQASKHVHVCTYVNTLPQCSPASVGLAQARPNYIVYKKYHLSVICIGPCATAYTYSI